MHEVFLPSRVVREGELPSIVLLADKFARTHIFSPERAFLPIHLDVRTGHITAPLVSHRDCAGDLRTEAHDTGSVQDV